MPFSSLQDLTGQVAWPALTVIGHYLTAPAGTALVKGQHCVELGAGIGVPGLLAAAAGAQSVVLTDHNQFVSPARWSRFQTLSDSSR